MEIAETSAGLILNCGNAEDSPKHALSNRKADKLKIIVFIILLMYSRVTPVSLTTPRLTGRFGLAMPSARVLPRREASWGGKSCSGRRCAQDVRGEIANFEMATSRIQWQI